MDQSEYVSNVYEHQLKKEQIVHLHNQNCHYLYRVENKQYQQIGNLVTRKMGPQGSIILQWCKIIEKDNNKMLLLLCNDRLLVYSLFKTILINDLSLNLNHSRSQFSYYEKYDLMIFIGKTFNEQFNTITFIKLFSDLKINNRKVIAKQRVQQFGLRYSSTFEELEQNLQEKLYQLMERSMMRRANSLMKIDDYDLVEINYKLFLVVGNKEDKQLYLINVQKCMENEDELQLDEELQHMRIMKGVEGMFSNVVFEKFKMIQLKNKKLLLLLNAIELNGQKYIEISIYELDSELNLNFKKEYMVKNLDNEWNIECSDDEIVIRQQDDKQNINI